MNSEAVEAKLSRTLERSAANIAAEITSTDQMSFRLMLLQVTLGFEAATALRALQQFEADAVHPRLVLREIGLLIGLVRAQIAQMGWPH